MTKNARFDQEAWNAFVIEHDVIGFSQNPITFKGGRECNCYVNWRGAVSDAWLIDRITDFLLAFASDRDLEPRCFFGVPEGATKLGVLAQYKWAKSRPDFALGAYPLAMGRGRPKDHGDPKDRYFVGQPSGKTVVLEDTTTTGGSLLDTIENLQQSGVEVIAAITLTNRMEIRDDGRSVEEVLSQEGVPFFALSNLPDLLPHAIKKLDPSPGIVADVNRYFDKYGIKNT